MTQLKSRYRIWGGFGLLLLATAMISWVSVHLLFYSDVALDQVNLIVDPDARLAYGVILGLNLFFLHRLKAECSIIKIGQDIILFINPFLPFIRKRIHWSEIDYYILVDEKSRYRDHEAVWLIRNQRIHGRFSSLFYSNYQELKQQIPAPSKGKKKLGLINQIGLLLGWKTLEA